jgi:hypothetical protein
MHRQNAFASVLEKDRNDIAARDARIDPKPLEEVIQEAKSEIARIFEQQDARVQAAPKEH